MKNILPLLALVVLVIFSLYACEPAGGSYGGGAGNSDSNGVSLNFSLEVLNTTPPPDSSSPGKLTTRHVGYHCSAAGNAVADTSIEFSSYVITNGNLYLWGDGDCAAGMLTGVSTTLTGSWTAAGTGSSSLGQTVPIPAAYRPSTCPSTSPSDTSGSGNFLPLQNPANAVYISPSNISIQISGTVCFASQFASALAPDSEFMVSTNGCGSAQVRNVSTEQTATLSSHFANNVLQVTYKSGNTTCSTAESLPALNTTPDCSNHGIDSVFVACLAGSGLYSPAGAAKIAASLKIASR